MFGILMWLLLILGGPSHYPATCSVEHFEDNSRRETCENVFHTCFVGYDAETGRVNILVCEPK